MVSKDSENWLVADAILASLRRFWWIVASATLAGGLFGLAAGDLVKAENYAEAVVQFSPSEITQTFRFSVGMEQIPKRDRVYYELTAKNLNTRASQVQRKKEYPEVQRWLIFADRELEAIVIRAEADNQPAANRAVARFTDNLKKRQDEQAAQEVDDARSRIPDLLGTLQANRRDIEAQIGATEPNSPTRAILLSEIVDVSRSIRTLTQQQIAFKKTPEAKVAAVQVVVTDAPSRGSNVSGSLLQRVLGFGLLGAFLGTGVAIFLTAHTATTKPKLGQRLQRIAVSNASDLTAVILKVSRRHSAKRIVCVSQSDDSDRDKLWAMLGEARHQIKESTGSRVLMRPIQFEVGGKPMGADLTFLVVEAGKEVRETDLQQFENLVGVIDVKL